MKTVDKTIDVRITFALTKARSSCCVPDTIPNLRSQMISVKRVG